MRALLMAASLAAACVAGCSRTHQEKPAAAAVDTPDAPIQESDEVFTANDPASVRSCRADADCPTGSLCHPGQLTCFSSYPDPRMLDVSWEVAEGPSAPPNPCALATVYFAFDSQELVDEAKRWLDYDAKCIMQRQPSQVLIEGHADARGDREYNRELARKRGEAVVDYLKEKGVSSPIRIVSRGETDPLMTGESERAYAYNRRVEMQAR